MTIMQEPHPLLWVKHLVFLLVYTIHSFLSHKLTAIMHNGLLIRPWPLSPSICLHYNWHVNEVKSSRTCLTTKTFQTLTGLCLAYSNTRCKWSACQGSKSNLSASPTITPAVTSGSLIPLDPFLVPLVIYALQGYLKWYLWKVTTSYDDEVMYPF